MLLGCPKNDAKMRPKWSKKLKWSQNHAKMVQNCSHGAQFEGIETYLWGDTSIVRIDTYGPIGTYGAPPWGPPMGRPPWGGRPPRIHRKFCFFCYICMGPDVRRCPYVRLQASVWGRAARVTPRAPARERHGTHGAWRSTLGGFGGQLDLKSTFPFILLLRARGLRACQTWTRTDFRGYVGGPSLGGRVTASRAEWWRSRNPHARRAILNPCVLL